MDEAVDPDSVLGAEVPFADVEGEEEDSDLPVAPLRPLGARLPPPSRLHWALRSTSSTVWGRGTRAGIHLFGTMLSGCNCADMLWKETEGSAREPCAGREIKGVGCHGGEGALHDGISGEKLRVPSTAEEHSYSYRD